MRIGVVLPQSEIGPTAEAVRRYAAGVEALGYTHVLAYEHVLGADPQVHAPWTGPYDVHTTFREPFVLFGFLAALTSIELVTGIVILPQRQTALVAKQAAEVDLLSEGRFRLGVGIGWNRVEYEALGESFATRGRRIDEQIPLLRRLWTEQVITHRGRFDEITAAGLAPLPVQRPIPVWLGGQSPAACARVGRVADGWFPQSPPGPRLEQSLAIVAAAAEAAGRDPAGIGMEGRVTWTDDGLDRLIEEVGSWQQAGATHVSVNTMAAGLEAPDGHLEVLERIADALAPFRSVADGQ